MKTALITGITGQDGSYLAELLLAKGYCVHGIVRRASTFNTDRLDPIYADPHQPRALTCACITATCPTASVSAAHTRRVRPDEIYNLAAQSHVRVSFDQAEYTADVVATGTLRLLEALRDHVQATGQAGSTLPGRLLGNVRSDAPAAK